MIKEKRRVKVLRGGTVLREDTVNSAFMKFCKRTNIIPSEESFKKYKPILCQKFGGKRLLKVEDSKYFIVTP